MKLPALVASLVVLGSLSSAHAQINTTYSFNLTPGTSAGNPVTNIMILEADASGSQLLIDYGGTSSGYTVNGTGFSSLSHTSAFNPAMSLLVGITQQIDRLSLVIFMNNAFAAQAAGTNFNPNFFSVTHNAFIARVQAAETGSEAELDWFRNVFWPIDGTRLAFATGGSYTAMEFTIGTTIGRVPEHANTGLLLILSCGIFAGGRCWTRRNT